MTNPISGTPSPPESSLEMMPWTSLWECHEVLTSPARWADRQRYYTDREENSLKTWVFQVVLYNMNLTNLHNLTGDQIGAYFGYTIATCDINGDGLDDILIGAPA